MPSFNAHVLNAILRLTMKRSGRRGIDVARSRRRTANPPARALRIPPDMRVEEIRPAPGLEFDVADSRVARDGEPRTIVYYLHGGGYFFGSPKTHRQINIALARVADGPGYSLAYRLAPEHPFPAAIEDSVAGYRWLLARHPGANIVIAGDSAGGGLALATMLSTRAAGLPLPKAFIGYSPWTDMAATGESITANARRCAMFVPEGIRAAATLYLAGADPRDPLASPLYADLTGLPPMLLFASRDETLYHDTTRLADRAQRAGVDVELVTKSGLPHVWPIFVSLLPEGREALLTVDTYLQRVLGAAQGTPVAPRTWKRS
jgi:epsilon-lactone hydrolase